MGAFDYFKNLYRSVIPNAAKGNRALERVAIHNAMKANSRPWEYDTDAKLQRPRRHRRADEQRYIRNAG